MKQFQRIAVAGALAAAMLASGAAIAQPGPWYPRPYGYGYGYGPRVGVVIGGPVFGPWYYPPPAYPYYYPPVVVAPASPPVYIEQGMPQAIPPQPPVAQAPPAPSQPAPAWYYCANPSGYYPYVKECPGGFQAVAPQPPPAPPVN